MKIAIIGDTHDNLINIKKALEYIQNQGITVLIHCGDITTMETIEFIRNNFKGDIHMVPGNAEINVDEEKEKAPKLKNTYFYPSVGAVELEGIKIAFTHEPWLAKKIAQENRYDVVFHGHTHDPWEEIVGNTKVLNPGNLAGIKTPPTFAIYDLLTQAARLVPLHAVEKNIRSNG